MILLDVLAASDLHVIVALWDVKKFYDTVPFQVVANELRILGYSKEKTLRTLLAHAVPSCIKAAGGCIPEPLDSRDNGLVAGCQRSTTAARAVTFRALDSSRKFTYDTLGCRTWTMEDDDPAWANLLAKEDDDARSRKKGRCEV